MSYKPGTTNGLILGAMAVPALFVGVFVMAWARHDPVSAMCLIVVAFIAAFIIRDINWIQEDHGDIQDILKEAFEALTKHI